MFARERIWKKFSEFSCSFYIPFSNILLLIFKFLINFFTQYAFIMFLPQPPPKSSPLCPPNFIYPSQNKQKIRNKKKKTKKSHQTKKMKISLNKISIKNKKMPKQSIMRQKVSKDTVEFVLLSGQCSWAWSLPWGVGNILRDTPLEKAVSFGQQLSVVDHFLVWDGSHVYFPLSSPVHAATVSEFTCASCCVWRHYFLRIIHNFWPLQRLLLLRQGLMYPRPASPAT